MSEASTFTTERSNHDVHEPSYLDIFKPDSHPGHWKKKKFVLGRYSSGGHWSCCGRRDKIASPCSAEMQESWSRFQTDADILLVKKVVRRAKAETAKSEWQSGTQKVSMERLSPRQGRDPKQQAFTTAGSNKQVRIQSALKQACLSFFRSIRLVRTANLTFPTYLSLLYLGDSSNPGTYVG